MAETSFPSETAGAFRLGSSRGQGWHVSPDRISTLRPRPVPRPVSFPAKPRAVEIDLARTALVAVDLQNDFLHAEGWFGRAGRQGRAPIAAIEAFAKACRGAGLPVVWLNWGLPGTAGHLPASAMFRGKREAAATGYGERSADRDEGTLHAGSWGAALADGLTREPGDHEVRKQRFSGFPDTHLDSLLRRMGVSTLLFCGINTDRCVFETLTDAAAIGYDCVLLSDLCATVSPPEIEAAVLWLVETLHGFVAQGPDLLAAFDSSAPTQEA
ncbi:cysteine hydrolase family protein [Aureimonas jatrophae]|uniref:Nicotinamidase-related amidase n=1 Tax=Aureimonas jatrophae TaxID=1166073 RepID=A0A1H0DHT0_9HYPH|nr:isochorismatase family cysteine hydrolase [Aureimonas jatrophae]MBB3951898.1 nicotinamidase-related amidase [Aureimonas jatrophae]SDN69705.1 Nicotinamidase-related amidase [Aureimonas jatrophae]